MLKNHVMKRLIVGGLALTGSMLLTFSAQAASEPGSLSYHKASETPQLAITTSNSSFTTTFQTVNTKTSRQSLGKRPNLAIMVSPTKRCTLTSMQPRGRNITGTGSQKSTSFAAKKF
ncbi:hypothetical protein [Lentilactobacillus parafarraginis]|uniref:hypothetical protein n=1 Tax=Lentilactobacillus parafarraginis TaxID=390842 RepID=UPI001CDD2AD2|nr:hypothetical protein [Lentilactobacillus parafarraginis]